MTRTRMAFVALLTLLLGTVGLNQAQAATSSRAGRTSVTLVLRAPHPAFLRRLAAARIGSRSDRARLLDSVLPSKRAGGQVRRYLVRHGFTVTKQTPWTLTVVGSRAAATRTFGGRATGRGTLPRLPAALRHTVAQALPTYGGPVTFQPRTSGSDYRAAYVPAGTPVSSVGTGAGTTIATVQLSTWNPSDLSTFAVQQGVPDPVASGQYVGVPVLDPGSSSGAVEVDLDQESLLATAPAAKQRAYFSTPYTAGYISALSAILADARNDPHLTAVSTSWGSCEENVAADQGMLGSFESVLQSLTAAGVTVFAASGDNGIYDCEDNDDTQVDYPAASPSVVGVGGTRLSGTGTANTGSNWTETAWSCTSTNDCYRSGTGGGASSEFAKPAWQSSALTAQPFAASTRRLVPDISAEGDPDTGFTIVSNGSTVPGVGGTSLAAPVSAALFDDALVATGHTTGAGDIHRALYSAYASAGLPATSSARAFRDITGGQNGSAADQGADPSVYAGAGYDTVSGLGAPLWPAVMPYLFPAPPPSVSSPPALSGPSSSFSVRMQRRSHRRPAELLLTWSSSATAPAAIVSSRLVVTDRATHKVAFRSSQPTGYRTAPVHWGHTYIATLVVTDSNGRSLTTSRRVRVPRR